MNAIQIADQVVAEIELIPNQFPNGGRNSEWTRAIKLAIGTLGEKLDYDVCGLGEHFDTGWLYDLCWYKSTADRKLLDMPLALESEWLTKYEHIKYDFEKL